MQYSIAARSPGEKKFRRLGRHTKTGDFHWWGSPRGRVLRKRKQLRATVHGDELPALDRWAEKNKKITLETPVEATPHIRGKEAKVHPRLLSTAELFMKRHAKGRVLDIISGYRSIAEQTRLWLGFISGKPGFNPANRPGTSKHEPTGGHRTARAFDGYVQGVAFWTFCDSKGLRSKAESMGLRQPHSHEPWHVELNGL